MSILSKAKNVASKARLRAENAVAPKRTEVREEPGPSPNAATNLLIADIAVRGAGIVFRHAVERVLLSARFRPEEAQEIVDGRTLGRSVVAFAAARMATRSVPGFLAVTGGLAAKAIVDRSLDHAKSRRAGDKTLRRRARRARKA